MPNDFILIDAVQPFANLIARRTGLDNFSSARIVLASGAALGLLCLQRTLHFHDTEGSRVSLVVLVVALTVLMAWRCDMDASRAADERVSNGMPAHSLRPGIMLARLSLLVFVLPARCLDIALHGMHPGDPALIGALVCAVVGFYLHACRLPPRTPANKTAADAR